MTRLAVIGAGIAGLAAAWEAQRAGATVVVFDAAGTPGGRLGTSVFAGRPVDDAADAFLTRVPDALELCAELGIDAEVVPPDAGAALLWWRGRLRALPEGQVLGVPCDLDALAASGLLEPGDVERAAGDLTMGPTPTLVATDSVGALVRGRMGDAVADVLVDPLIGGINAGHIDHLSLRVAGRQLAAALERSPSLIEGLRSLTADRPATGPVFGGFRTGMATLVDRLTDALTGRGADLRTGCGVRSVEPAPGGCVLVTGRGRERFDGCVVATPAGAAAGLVGGSPAAPLIAAVRTASVALVVMEVPAEVVRAHAGVSGFLVPRPERRLLTACSFASNKWSHLDSGDMAVVRASVGRVDDPRGTQLDDGTLVAAVTAELSDALGAQLRPGEVAVRRHPGAFPQFAPGHPEHLRRIRALLSAWSPVVAVAGAWTDGVGIPACVASGRGAARSVLSTLGGGDPPGG